AGKSIRVEVVEGETLLGVTPLLGRGSELDVGSDQPQDLAEHRSLLGALQSVAASSQNGAHGGEEGETRDAQPVGPPAPDLSLVHERLGDVEEDGCQPHRVSVAAGGAPLLQRPPVRPSQPATRGRPRSAGVPPARNGPAHPPWLGPGAGGSPRCGRRCAVRERRWAGAGADCHPTGSRYGSATMTLQPKTRSSLITSRPTRPAPQMPTTRAPSSRRDIDRGWSPTLPGA